MHASSLCACTFSAHWSNVASTNLIVVVVIVVVIFVVFVDEFWRYIKNFFFVYRHTDRQRRL